MHSFFHRPLRNVFPQDGLWPGSEPNVNILAVASPLNRIEWFGDKRAWGREEREGGEGRDLVTEFRDEAVCQGLFSQWVPG